MKPNPSKARQKRLLPTFAGLLTLFGFCLGLAIPFLALANAPTSGAAPYTEGVSLLAWDTMTGRFHLCSRLSSSSSATQCGLTWCQKSRVTPSHACDLSQHCIFPGFAAAAIGPYHNEDTGFHFHAATACGERSTDEATRSALRRCEGEVYGPRHCKIVSQWQVR